MTRGKYEGECGQDHTIDTSNYGKRIGPTDAAKTKLKAIRIGTANFTKIIRVPAEREGGTGNDHANRCNKYETHKILQMFLREKVSLNYQARPENIRH